MKIAIVGCRDWNKEDEIKIRDKIKRCIDLLPKDTIVVSGGARGVDSWAANYAKEIGLPAPQIFLPDYEKYGKAAPFVRNKTIIENADLIIAFWDGKSKGTLHAINIAKELNKRIRIIYP